MALRTIAHEAVAEKTVSRSIFIARAWEAADEPSTRVLLARTKEANPRADHYGYAYRLSADADETAHWNDGGEPAGSAGRPILGAILSARLTNVMVVVARYFGGKKLGIPGLIDAYQTAASEVLARAGVTIRIPCCLLSVSVPYRQLALVQHLARTHTAQELEAAYGTEVILRLKVPLTAKDSFLAALAGYGLMASQIGIPN